MAGLSPWILTANAPENGKLLAAIPPLLLLGALGLNRFLDSIAERRGGVLDYNFAVFLLAVCGAWGAARAG
jgi:hypothetical protein